MRFIDLFAGLGGFHLALTQLGHTCVFASELDEGLRKLYAQNFGIEPAGDIRKVGLDSIPPHDILCAGFPCQPFSKAGDQKGFEHPLWGDLFDNVLQVLNERQPQYFILENVPNIERHDGGCTFRKIQIALKDAGYFVKQKRLSPHMFGVPQIRERIFIVGSRAPLTHFEWPPQQRYPQLSITSALDPNPPDAKRISKQVQDCLNVWQDFLDRFPKDEELPSFPIWSMEFGATYPYVDTTPHAVGADDLGAFRGNHGIDLATLPLEQRIQALPSYARTPQTRFPTWKVQFIRQNREFYARHKQWIDEWMPTILTFPPSLQKFEWNCKGERRVIWDFVIQFRASGVRVKRPTTSPSLVAMTTTQVPIIGWERRYMTPQECARLQSMGNLANLPLASGPAFKALGNAVNVKLVQLIAARLFATGERSAASDETACTEVPDPIEAVQLPLMQLA